MVICELYNLVLCTFYTLRIKLFVNIIICVILFLASLFNKKGKLVTCDTWHVTCDMWHTKYDTWLGVNIFSKFQLPSSYCLWFMILWRSGGKGSLSELISNEAVYRTAPATPGLLKIFFFLAVFKCTTVLTWVGVEGKLVNGPDDPGHVFLVVALGHKLLQAV